MIIIIQPTRLEATTFGARQSGHLRGGGRLRKKSRK